MIRLNTDKGWARINSWDDVLTRPGFVTDVDPKAVTLKSIIGSYVFSAFLPCGLSTCHKPHGRGYLVTTSDGRETNIGKDCGKKYFSVDFESMARTFDRELRAQERREAITAFQHQIPAIRARIRALKEGDQGANWLHKHLTYMVDARAGLPPDVLRTVDRLVKRRVGTLTTSRLATADEMVRMRAQGQRVQAGETYVEEVVGRLDGIAALFKENDLRHLLVEQMKDMDAVEAADVSAMTEAELRRVAKWTITVEPNLKQAGEVLEVGRRFLTRSNLEQLARYVANRDERRRFGDFLSKLPTGQAGTAKQNSFVHQAANASGPPL